MGAPYQVVDDHATTWLDSPVGALRQPCRLVDAILRAAHGLWRPPFKLPAELAACAKVEQRTAERWLAHDTGLSAEALAALLRSEHGLHFLTALMSEATPAWWRGFRAACERADLRRRQNELRRRLDRLEEAGD